MSEYEKCQEMCKNTLNSTKMGSSWKIMEEVIDTCEQCKTFNPEMKKIKDSYQKYLRERTKIFAHENLSIEKRDRIAESVIFHYYSWTRRELMSTLSYKNWVIYKYKDFKNK